MSCDYIKVYFLNKFIVFSCFWNGIYIIIISRIEWDFNVEVGCWWYEGVKSLEYFYNFKIYKVWV